MKLNNWEDLPKGLGVFTICDTAMVNLDKNEVVKYYSANTKIEVVQKNVTKDVTYYRTQPAKDRGLNWAFEATALGLPNDKAPSAHSEILPPNSDKSASRTPKAGKKTKTKPKVILPKDGEGASPRGLLKRLFRKIKK